MSNRRDLLKLAGVSPLVGLSPAMLFAAQGGKLASITMSADKATVTEEPFGTLRVYFDGPTDLTRHMTAGSLHLKAGQTPHAPHRHEEEEFMVVTEGTGEINVEGTIAKVGPGSMMYAAANQSHGILNTGRTPLMFYYYKWK